MSLDIFRYPPAFPRKLRKISKPPQSTLFVFMKKNKTE